jgi:hypothetical protein
VEELGPAAMVGDARKLGARWGEPSSSSPTPGGEAPAATTGGARGGSGGAPGGGVEQGEPRVSTAILWLQLVARISNIGRSVGKNLPRGHTGLAVWYFLCGL